MIQFLEQYLTSKQFADKVGVTQQNLGYYLKNSIIEATLFHDRWYIHKDQLKAWPPKKKKMGRPRKNARKP